jgi:hypothetical protein
MRSAQVSRNRVPEALAWAKEVAGFVEKKFQTPPIEVFMDAFGPTGTVRWMIDFPDLAAVEKVLAETTADPEFWKLAQKAYAAELFIDGATHDNVARKI